MTNFNLICPDCGGAILHECGATHANLFGAIQQPDGQVAQVSETGSKTATKDGRQAYNQDYPSEFLTFWNIYPRHRDKRKALKAWRNAIRRATIYEINGGAIRYRNDPNRLDEFTKYAEGWLNGDGWEDEPMPARTERNAKPPDPPRALIGDEGMEEVRRALYGSE